MNWTALEVKTFVVAVTALAFGAALADPLTLTWNGGATGNLSDES